jgi:hypothetical protein
MTVQNLFDRLHTSQELHNTPAALAFRRAIERLDANKPADAEYWRLLGEYELVSTFQTSEPAHA